MARKQRTYFPTKKAKGQVAADRPVITSPGLATINLAAGRGRPGILAGARVTILGGGLYSGETAVVERLVEGVIPSAVVRTEGGRTRQVRTIDLAPVAGPSSLT